MTQRRWEGVLPRYRVDPSRLGDWWHVVDRWVRTAWGPRIVVPAVAFDEATALAQQMNAQEEQGCEKGAQHEQS